MTFALMDYLSVATRIGAFLPADFHLFGEFEKLARVLQYILIS
jgi:hypothetical protein